MTADHGKPEFPSTTWLVAAHGMLCVSALTLHLVRYPLHQSLFFWWFGPFDATALILITPLYLKAKSAPWGLCFNIIISGVEAIALVFLGLLDLKTPLTLNASGMLALNSAFLVAVRIPLGWFIAMAIRPTAEIFRGCQP